MLHHGAARSTALEEEPTVTVEKLLGDEIGAHSTDDDNAGSWGKNVAFRPSSPLCIDRDEELLRRFERFELPRARNATRRRQARQGAHEGAEDVVASKGGWTNEKLDRRVRVESARVVCGCGASGDFRGLRLRATVERPSNEWDRKKSREKRAAS